MFLGCKEKEHNKKDTPAKEKILFSFQTNDMLFSTPLQTVDTKHNAGKNMKLYLYWYTRYTGINFNEYVGHLKSVGMNINYPYERIISKKIVKKNDLLSIVKVKYQYKKTFQMKYANIFMYLTNVNKHWKIYGHFNEDSAIP